MTLLTKKKNRAVFTICRNEKTFLPIWIAYYSKYFNQQDIYVIDNNTVDGSVSRAFSNYGFNWVKWDNELAFDHRAITDRVQKMQRDLLERYENVLFCEIDEILFAEKGLDKFIIENVHDTVQCIGLNIIHMHDEPAIDMAKPIMSQRKYFFIELMQNKPLLSKVPLTWDYGFHNCKEPYMNYTGLHMIHLNRFDFDKAYERTIDQQKLKFHEGDKAAGYGVQKSLTGQEYKSQFFYNTKGETIEEFPQWIKDLELV